MKSSSVIIFYYVRLPIEDHPFLPVKNARHGDSIATCGKFNLVTFCLLDFSAGHS